jgi:hypothetical protein
MKEFMSPKKTEMNMTRNMEIPAPGDKRREAVRHRRIQRRQATQLSGFFLKAGCSRDEEYARARFRFDSIVPAVERDPPKSPMRVLLRHAKTMKFFRSGERWTKDPKQARDFRNGWWATVHAFTMNPRHLVIHYVFDDDRYNLHIPVVGHHKT